MLLTLVSLGCAFSDQHFSLPDTLVKDLITHLCPFSKGKFNLYEA